MKPHFIEMAVEITEIPYFLGCRMTGNGPLRVVKVQTW